MAVTYTDQEIESLVLERKPLPADGRIGVRIVGRLTKKQRVEVDHDL